VLFFSFSNRTSNKKEENLEEFSFKGELKASIGRGDKATIRFCGVLLLIEAKRLPAARPSPQKPVTLRTSPISGCPI
jgi:hypothetical protein